MCDFFCAGRLVFFFCCKEPDGFLPLQRVSRAQALKSMTLDAAYASFWEREIGSIEEGKWADFVVWDQNIMDENSDPVRLLSAQAVETYLGGKKVYERDSTE